MGIGTELLEKWPNNKIPADRVELLSSGLVYWCGLLNFGVITLKTGIRDALTPLTIKDSCQRVV